MDDIPCDKRNCSNIPKVRTPAAEAFGAGSMAVQSMTMESLGNEEAVVVRVLVAPVFLRILLAPREAFSRKAGWNLKQPGITAAVCSTSVQGTKEQARLIVLRTPRLGNS